MRILAKRAKRSLLSSWSTFAWTERSCVIGLLNAKTARLSTRFDHTEDKQTEHIDKIGSKDTRSFFLNLMLCLKYFGRQHLFMLQKLGPSLATFWSNIATPGSTDLEFRGLYYIVREKSTIRISSVITNFVCHTYILSFGSRSARRRSEAEATPRWSSSRADHCQIIVWARRLASPGDKLDQR